MVCLIKSPVRLGRIRRLTKTDLFLNGWTFFALGFGSGLSRLAPGTMGSLIAIPLYLALLPLTSTFYIVVVLFVICIGIIICGKAADSLSEHDHPGIVWDEIAGILLTFCFIPFSWLALILGFVLFRIFDILKPWPIKVIDQRVSGGLGIMLDDLIAAIFANICLRILLELL